MRCLHKPVLKKRKNPGRATIDCKLASLDQNFGAAGFQNLPLYKETGGFLFRRRTTIPLFHVRAISTVLEIIPLFPISCRNSDTFFYPNPATVVYLLIFLHVSKKPLKNLCFYYMLWRLCQKELKYDGIGYAGIHVDTKKIITKGDDEFVVKSSS